MAIGKDKTIKPGNLSNKTFNAMLNGKSNSTIFLTRSNITPTDTETTVNAEIEKIKGLKTDQIEKVLGYASKSEIIHRDDMVKL